MCDVPVKVDSVPQRLGPPPLLGEHTDQVLKELLGLSREDVARLKEEKTI
jgi:crotonobetainyl-CoA:carnitine CoA-transferase CaiB-like acyl-CoA transferase